MAVPPNVMSTNNDYTPPSYQAYKSHCENACNDLDQIDSTKMRLTYLTDLEIPSNILFVPSHITSSMFVVNVKMKKKHYYFSRLIVITINLF